MPGGPSPRLDSAGASRSGGGGPAPAPGIKGNPEQYYQLLEGERRTRGVPKPAELRSSNGTPDSPPIGAGRPPAPSAGRPQPPAGPGEGSPGPGGAANSPKAVPPPGPPPATDNVAAPVTDQPRGKPGAGQSSVVDHSQTEGAEPSTGRYRQRQFDAIISSQAAANPRFVWVTLNPNVSDEQVADTLGRNILAETPPGGDALPDNRGKAVDPKSGSKDQLNYKLPLSTATNGSGQVLRVRGSIAQMENFVSELRKASAQVDWIVPPQSDAKKLVAGKAEWTDRSVPEQAWLENRVENFENRKNLAPLARNPSVVDEYFVVLFRVPAVDNAVGAITNSTQAGSTPAAPTKPREKPVPAEPAAKPGAP